MTAVCRGLLCGLVVFLEGCTMLQSMKTPYVEEVRQAFARQPLAPDQPVTEAELARVPLALQRYLRYVGAVGRPKPQNFRLVFDVEMRKKPGARPMIGQSEQYNFFAHPTRLFYMKVRMFGIPADGLHAYAEEKASMRIRVASLFDAVNASGAVLDETETVTVLNDLCLLAPAALLDDRRATFEEVDARTLRVRFVNGPHAVSATLHFAQDDGRLVDFVSDDRSALQDDGSFRKLRFSTPIHGYRDLGGRRVISEGSAVFHYPEGAFAYGKFTLREIEYNFPRFRDGGL